MKTTKNSPAPAPAPAAKPATVLNVYALTERGEGEQRKTFWTRIGRAFKNRDNSLTLRLEALPVSGVAQIREEDPTRFDHGGDGE